MRSRNQRVRMAVAMFCFVGGFLMFRNRQDASPAGSPDPSAVAGSPAASPSAGTPDPSAAPPAPAARTDPGAPDASPEYPGGSPEPTPGSDDPGSAPATSSTTPTLIRYYVARRPIPRHTRLSPRVVEDYLEERVERNASRVPRDAVKDPASMVDMVTAAPIAPGTPIVTGKLVDALSVGKLAVAIPEGMRAISLSITDINAVSGFVGQGDLVDIYHHLTIAGEMHTYVLLQSVKVLAVNSDHLLKSRKRQPGRRSSPRPTPSPSAASGQPGGPPGPGQDRIIAGETTEVTFLVTPRDAHILIQALAGSATLSLALRGSDDLARPELDSVTDDFMSETLKKKRNEVVVGQVEVLRGVVTRQEEVKIRRELEPDDGLSGVKPLSTGRP